MLVFKSVLTDESRESITSKVLELKVTILSILLFKENCLKECHFLMSLQERLVITQDNESILKEDIIGQKDAQIKLLNSRIKILQVNKFFHIN